ncbi:hypothetical protein K2173_016627 [Erythroxylum novogranatense]|uniref:RING-type domain-containing protein n=1 Tax=Erythroxylum novogranatense TaxID=1862640 RepID=A0AAV8SGR2_9ROSI|nr:hypothetical protein K2173_016627 [Erythroxylum novogranatense]
MGFDNECIPNIHSLAGEYFCPVCRLLVYPNEALQSQCTHLYCKPCLTYVVSTTRACPYDGYLVTEADAKPLVESNKTLAETIGKVTVHCLYHRSGCTWQGPLSECTNHCSACAFGNSPVVCNRCAVQIVHRQVQEHAQNCPGVQLQTQHSEGQSAATTGAGPTSDQTQAATQVGMAITQVQSVASSQPGQDPNAHVNVTSQAHPGLQTAAPTGEQWYQQQQQYQQYYQSYPGYDPYQQHYQHYYPYQQQPVAQSQQPQTYIQPQHPQAQQQTHLQVQPQVPQTQPLSQPPPHPSHSQVPVVSQPHNQAQFSLQQQTHPAIQPQSHVQQQSQLPIHGHPPPQAQSHAQAQIVQSYPQSMQMPQNQQPQPQMQHLQPQSQVQTHSQFYPQHHPVPLPLPVSHSTQMHAQHHPHPNQPVNPSIQPQAHHLSANAVTGHHSYPQPQPQQIQLGNRYQQIDVHPQSGSQLQSQHPGQMQFQLPQQHPLRPPPQATFQNLQQPVLLPVHDQPPNAPPLQQLPAHSHSHQPVVPVHQRPVMQPVQPPMNQQYLQHQQPSSGQPLGPGQNQKNQLVPYIQQEVHAQSPIRPQCPPQLLQQQPQQNIALTPGMLNHQSVTGGAPVLPHGVPTLPYPQSPGGTHLRPVQVGVNQHSGNFLRANNQVPLLSELHCGAGSKPMSDRSDGMDDKGVEAEKSSQKAVTRDMDDSDTVSGIKADNGAIKNVKSESDIKLVEDENKAIGEATQIASGGHWSKTVKEEAIEGTGEQKDTSDANHKKIQSSVSDGKEIKETPLLKAPIMQECEHTKEQVVKLQEQKAAPEISGGHSVLGQIQGAGLLQRSQTVQVPDERKQHPPQSYYGPPFLQKKSVLPSVLQVPSPGFPHHTQSSGHVPQLRPLDPVHIPHFGQALNSLPEHSQHPMYKQPYGPEVLPAGIPGPGFTSAFGRGSGLHARPPGPYNQGHTPPTEVEHVLPPKQSNNADDRRLDPFGLNSDMYSNKMRSNGVLARDSSSTLGLRDDPSKTFPDEHLIPLPQDPTRRTIDDDLKHIPNLDVDRAHKFGSKFASSGCLDKVHHGVGMDIAQGPPGKVPYSLNHDKFEPPASSVPTRFIPPFHHDGMLHPSDVGGSPVGFSESAPKMSNSGRVYPEYFGSGPGYGNWHRDHLVPRSPGGDYPRLSFHRFGAHPGPDDISSVELNQFGGPISSSFHDSKFHGPPGNFHRGDFESPGNLHLRSRRHDGLPHHLYRAEHVEPHELPSNLQRGESFGFGAYPGHARMGNFVDPGHPRFGEPGFRRNFAGNLEPYENSRKRKPTTMGWCRICKVDCETVEGLDLHSQTREHQKMAMDMVLTIKQKAKKQKSDSIDHTSLDGASKSNNVATMLKEMVFGP